jgi:type IV pilus assembly protein PilF
MPRLLSTRIKASLSCALAIGAVATSVSCAAGRGKGATGPDSDRQSEAEYDIARDLFISRHDARGALDHALKATEINDENAEAYHLVTLIYLYFCSTSQLDCRLPEAEISARRAVQFKADFREAKNTLGVVLIQRKKFDEAIAVLKPLSADILYQTPWDAWGNLGLAYLGKGLADNAIEALRHSIAAEPRFCVGNYRLGLAYEKKADLVAAREAFNRAINTDRPECQALQDAFEARARVLSNLKKCDLARSDWERCKQIAADTPTGQRCAANLKASPC